MMIFRLVTIAIIISCISVSSLAQQFIPQELQEAYANKTRNTDGSPGENYFQNYSDYDITVHFDPESGYLEGTAHITYHNNAPDTIKQLVIRNYMNIFQKGVTRDFSIGEADLHNGVEISDVAINDTPLENPKSMIRHRGTIMTLQLPEPLPPNHHTKLSLKWAFTMPRNISIRMGRYGKDNWMVAYWYPQIAVYDDLTGWDTHPFTGSAEFYNDFNNFNVKIEVPDDYLVWATGLLSNEEDRFSHDVLKRLEQSRQGDEVVKIITEENLEKGNILKARGPWTYVAESVPDFAFAVSKRYVWDAASVSVAPGKRVWVDAVYKPDSEDFHKVAALSAQIIRLFSEEVIGEPFPYPQLTAFNGGGGMEFPMMINDGDARTHKGTVNLTAHEIGHTYFPFYVMTNESFYAFMDEGLVSFIPRLAEGIILDDPDPMRGIVQGYAARAATMRQAPLMLPSDMISDYAAYRTHAYTRPANAFFILQQMLGKDTFKAVIQEYIVRWRWKHPTPYDFFNTVEEVTGQELDWFWNPWFFEFGYPDLAITGVDQDKGNYAITVDKRGSLPVPLQLTIHYSDGTSEKVSRSADIWRENERHIVKHKTDKEVSYIYLGGMNIPDSFPDDNMYMPGKK